MCLYLRPSSVSLLLWTGELTSSPFAASSPCRCTSPPTASAIAVSIHNEARANRTRRFLGLGRRTDRDPETKRSSIRGPKRRFSGKTPAAQAAGEAETEAPVPPPVPESKASSLEPPGTRRNVYVNWVRTGAAILSPSACLPRLTHAVPAKPHMRSRYPRTSCTTTTRSLASAVTKSGRASTRF